MKANFSTLSATYVLAGLWVACFSLALGVLALLFFTDSISAGSIAHLLDQLSSVYAPYLGALLVYCFAARTKNRRTPKLNALSFWLSLVTSLLWNAVVLCLLFRVLGVLRGNDAPIKIDEALKLAKESGARLAWIVSPAIGFFFAKPSESKE